jgi:CheY-like chemotaxis protein
VKSKKSVLIAEDDYASRELLRSKMEEHNCEYFLAEDGKSAVDLFVQHPDINLVFMDIRLPEMDGIEAMKQIKGIRKNTVVIAQTAYIFSVEKDKQLYLSNGFDEFIEKPFNLDHLSRLIEQYN